MEAPSREVVFAELREQGIKAIKVVAADDSKANGEVRGVRKRAVATLVALVALGVGVVAYRGGTRSVASVASNGGGRGATALPFLTDTTRRQVIGDAAIIEKGIRTGWADVFSHEGVRFLASFAIPGVKAGVGTTSVAALKAVLTATNRFARPSTIPSLRSALKAELFGGYLGGIPTGEGKTVRRNFAVASATCGKEQLGIEAQQIIRPRQTWESCASPRAAGHRFSAPIPRRISRLRVRGVCARKSVLPVACAG